MQTSHHHLFPEIGSVTYPKYSLKHTRPVHQHGFLVGSTCDHTEIQKCPAAPGHSYWLLGLSYVLTELGTNDLLHLQLRVGIEVGGQDTHHARPPELAKPRGLRVQLPAGRTLRPRAVTRAGIEPRIPGLCSSECPASSGMFCHLVLAAQHKKPRQGWWPCSPGLMKLSKGPKTKAAPATSTALRQLSFQGGACKHPPSPRTSWRRRPGGHAHTSFTSAQAPIGNRGSHTCSWDLSVPWG